jgi:hypothetical protein
VRNLFSTMARGVTYRWETPEEPSDGDLEAQDFAYSVLEDVDGGMSAFTDQLVSNVPFFGWGWWEALPGYRSQGWKPPNRDPWRSTADDNRIGIRRFAWRDSSSFAGWDMEENGALRGMKQGWSTKKAAVTIPLENSLHVTFGDNHNPEGLSPLEAIWRLERIKYGLEVVQGIGFEHAAGHLSVTANKTLTAADKTEIAKAARAILSAQEGNYAAWPEGIVGEIKDVNFQAASAILEAIKYYGILKLTVFNAQWVALSAMSGVGSNAAMSDSSSMWLMGFNAMMDGFAAQIDAQIGKRLFTWNQFPGMTARPILKVDPINKVNLGTLGSVLSVLKVPLGDDDYIAIRKQSGFLPETLPDLNTPAAPAAAVVDDSEPDSEPEADEEEAAETIAEATAASLIKYRAWARKHNAEQFAQLEREA